jgi:clan AA aspartic protease
MIIGTVNRRHEAVITLPVRDSSGRDRAVEAVLDTGFTGSLTLPSSLIESLDLPWRSRGGAVLANGKVEQCDIYAAVVVWDGIERSVLVEAMENVPLLGMAMLVGYDLRVRVIAGERVEIEAVP